MAEEIEQVEEIEPVEREIRRVVAPLTMDQIKEFFINKNLLFVIDYAKSSVKGKVFLTYISNLDLPAEVDFADTSVEERMELLKDFMESRNINETKGLTLLTAAVLLHNKGVNIERDIVPFVPLSLDEMKAFAAKNPALMERWYTFLDSMMLFAMYSVQLVETTDDGSQVAIPAFETAFPGFFDKYEKIDDPLYIGSNVVNLFRIPLFLELYFSIPAPTPGKYFKQQFTEYMFKGKRLIHYFDVPENSFFSFLVALCTKQTTVEKMIEALQGT